MASLRRLTVAWLCVCLAGTALAGSEWDQASRDLVVEKHNSYRRMEGQCQMNKIIYDMELEAMAKDWAERCIFKHSHTEGVGENLAFDTSREPQGKLIESACASWHSEKKDFSYEAGSCGQACHYTQMIWGATRLIGCYSCRCSTLQQAGASDAWNFVCMYAPRGNWVGEKPYPTTCTSDCLEGQTVDSGLCVGTPPCKDKHENCEQWAGFGQCKENPSYMNKHCRKSCNTCDLKLWKQNKKKPRNIGTAAQSDFAILFAGLVVVFNTICSASVTVA